MCCPNRYLELSLPKFSLTALTDLKALLTAMDLEALLGSDAQFQRLSNKEKFTIDQVEFLIPKYYLERSFINHFMNIYFVTTAKKQMN